MAYGGKTLTVYLAADISKLKSGLNGANREMSGFGDKLNKLVGPALIGAAAAAGAFAVSLAVDGVQAAIQEEAELSKLGKTLDNLGFGAQTDQVNEFIDGLQYTAAVTDSELRPAFSRLLTATNDVTQSQKLLELALDVSAGTGKSLETVTNALGKAYDGNLGALGKLGAGIDASVIKSKDLNGAISQLSSTFSGQAEAAANTLQGRIKTLGIAFDELKESFGTGFLSGVQESTGSLSEMTQLLRDSQEAAQELGRNLGELAADLLKLTGEAWRTYKAFDAWTKNDAIGRIAGFIGDVLNLGNPFSILRKGIEGTAAATDVATDSILANARGLILWQSAAGQVDNYVRGGYTGIPAKTMFFDLETWREKQLALIKPIKDTTTTTGGLGKVVDTISPKLQKQIDLVKNLTTQLGDASKAVETARKDMTDWQESMAASITSGIDLGAAYNAQFDDEGKKTGQSLLAGFQKQIDQSNWFGDILTFLNREGGPELRDAVAALGPETGGKLGQQMIDEGLVKTFQDKLTTVKQTARTTADAMTPEFLIAGVNSAVQFLIGTQNTLAAATNDLEAMGAAMGKTIGDAAATAILEAVNKAREALGQGQTTLAGTSTPSTLTNGLPSAYAGQNFSGGMGFIGPDAVAQAIARAIANSNARLGAAPQNVLQ